MTSRIVKNVACRLDVWFDGDFIFSESGLLFGKTEDVESYLNEKFTHLKAQTIQYYISQAGEKTDIHKSYTVQ